jgi:hypothetical protein
MVRVACSPPGASKGRKIEIRAGSKVVGEALLPDESPGTDVSVELRDPVGELFARLTGKDAISVDDEAPVLAVTGELMVAIVADPANSKLVTRTRPSSRRLCARARHARAPPAPFPDRTEDLRRSPVSPSKIRRDSRRKHDVR